MNELLKFSKGNAKLDKQINIAINRIKKWKKTGYYSCCNCGYKGERPFNHDRRCKHKAKFIL